MTDPEHLDILEQGIDVWNEWRSKHKDVLLDLSGVDLYDMDFSGADFRSADLTDANLSRANLSWANLFQADLTKADLNRAILIGTNCRGADLSGAHLSGAYLDSANFSDVRIGYTSLAENNLSVVKGLERVIHLAPSYVSIDTIYKSQGMIPESFLRGCGVPEDFITYMRSLTGKAIEFYSCFISYSSKDQECAERLHADLQAKGVRVWFAPHDMPIGARIRPTIDESSRVYDKLLLVLSEHSVGSRWVEQEVETALAKEDEAGREVLFPVRLDEAVTGIQAGWPALVKRTRHVGDFTRWKDHDSYQKAFDRLLRDLKAEA